MPNQIVTHRILEQPLSLARIVCQMIGDVPDGMTTHDIRLRLLDRQMLVDAGDLSACLYRIARAGKLRRVYDRAAVGARGPKMVWRYFGGNT